MTFKNAFFRIFWKIPAKTSPETLYLCGFLEASVEMRVAPFRALPPFIFYLSFPQPCRNAGRPFQGIATLQFCQQFLIDRFVEMRVAPFRALPPVMVRVAAGLNTTGRNVPRPTQGISKPSIPGAHAPGFLFPFHIIVLSHLHMSKI